MRRNLQADPKKFGEKGIGAQHQGPPYGVCFQAGHGNRISMCDLVAQAPGTPPRRPVHQPDRFLQHTDR